MSTLRRTSHAVYDIKYHLVWIPKYRKKILVGQGAAYVRALLFNIAEHYGREIDTLEVSEDHVHVLLIAPPKYSPSEVVQMMKSISARYVFRRFPEVREQVWGGEFWSDGFFVRTGGDAVTSEVIRQYLNHHADHRVELGSLQLELDL